MAQHMAHMIPPLLHAPLTSLIKPTQTNCGAPQQLVYNVANPPS